MEKKEWEELIIRFKDGTTIHFGSADLERFKEVEHILRAFTQARELKDRLDHLFPRRQER